MSNNTVNQVTKQNPAGIILIDKPQGWTSHDVVAKIRSITKVKKVGHAGTLDPLATGLLVILVGREYTKLQSRFLKQDKTYRCIAQLGLVSDSYDAEGNILAEADWQEIVSTTPSIESVVMSFLGKSKQTVPAFSAVKVDGKKLYQKARQGKTVHIQLPTRIVEIKKIRDLGYQLNQEEKSLFFSFEVTCSSGTYIRSFVHDIGQKLHVGAIVSQLRRIQSGELLVDSAVTIAEFEENF